MRITSGAVLVVTHCALAAGLVSAAAKEQDNLTAPRPAERAQNVSRSLKNAGKESVQSIAIRHLGKNELGQLVSESANFRIVHNQSKQLVERVAVAAERLRPAIHRKWFGDVCREWDGKCLIYLHANHKSYLTTTKQVNTLGHARTFMLGDEISLRSIHLPCGEPTFFDVLLPHELTHAVMAVRFRGRLPRWANEGMATLAETKRSRASMRKHLEASRRKDDLFALEVLMKTGVAAQVNTLEYYAQATSLVEFFSAEADRPTFTRFLAESLLVGYEVGLKKHYGIPSFAELERRWLAFAFSSAQVPAGSTTAAQPALRRSHVSVPQ